MPQVLSRGNSAAGSSGNRKPRLHRGSVIPSSRCWDQLRTKCPTSCRHISRCVADHSRRGCLHSCLADANSASAVTRATRYRHFHDRLRTTVAQERGMPHLSAVRSAPRRTTDKAGFSGRCERCLTDGSAMRWRHSAITCGRIYPSLTSDGAHP